MINIKEYINEASINAKKRNIKFAKSWFANGEKNLGNIGSFGIITAENPNSHELSRQENKKLMNEFKKSIKRHKTYIFVELDGHFGGNVEHSLLIMNIKKNELEAYAAKYEQTSFFYCYPSDDKTVVSEYWEKKTNGEPYDKDKNPYEMKDSSTKYIKLDDADDNFSVIGGDFKYTIDLDYFKECNEKIETRLIELSNKYNETPEAILEWAVNRVGRKATYYNNYICAE